MDGCIYARYDGGERESSRVERQVEVCRNLASEHGLFVIEDLIFTDFDVGGELMPQHWVMGDGVGRPALACLLQAIEAHGLKYVLVERLDALATSSALLYLLRDFFQKYGVQVVCNHGQRSGVPAVMYAAQVLEPVLKLESDAEIEKRQRKKKKILDEVARLQKKIVRLEAEAEAL